VRGLRGRVLARQELINAIFFADTGRRVLPATPGRTTMCPVELGYDASLAPELALLPIDSRLEGASISDMRERTQSWTRIRLDPSSPKQLSEALAEVTRTKAVTVDTAKALGFWSDDNPADNPPSVGDGLVEIPAWRHATINYPHPLLQRGLVVLDTPGLNAIGAEPELTLSLLPTAHAIVFILAADTGVTKSDLSIWNDHLSAQAKSRFVVLNKIDAMVDPLQPPELVTAQIAKQCEATARTLQIPVQRVFPMSARSALAARIERNPRALADSRLPALEDALATELLPRRREVIAELVEETAGAVQQHALRRLGDQRRQAAEQLLELRGLRGKSSSKVQLMIERVDGETREFELCTQRLTAMRQVHGKILRELMDLMSSDSLRDELFKMQKQTEATVFNFGAKKAFIELCERLRGRVAEARGKAIEVHDMLAASFAQLNREFGFALQLSPLPSLDRCDQDLDKIEASYVQYLGLKQALRLAEPRFMEQFRRMLLSKLRMTFEFASGEYEMWSKSASNQVDSQLRERRRSFKRRREGLDRVLAASGELDQRIADVQTQDERLQQLATLVGSHVQALCAQVSPLAIPANPADPAQPGPSAIAATG
jgi:Dynamin family